MKGAAIGVYKRVQWALECLLAVVLEALGARCVYKRVAPYLLNAAFRV